MTPEAFKQRTKQFALRVMRLVEKLPRSHVGDVLGRQLLKSATSVGANYRAACRARSKAEFRAKLGIVEEEAQPVPALVVEGKLMRKAALSALMKEADEIVALVVASLKTVRKKRK